MPPLLWRVLSSPSLALSLAPASSPTPAYRSGSWHCLCTSMWLAQDWFLSCSPSPRKLNSQWPLLPNTSWFWSHVALPAETDWRGRNSSSSCLLSSSSNHATVLGSNRKFLHKYWSGGTVWTITGHKKCYTDPYINPCMHMLKDTLK